MSVQQKLLSILCQDEGIYFQGGGVHRIAFYLLPVRRQRKLDTLIWNMKNYLGLALPTFTKF
jgi:hypothetical protein